MKTTNSAELDIEPETPSAELDIEPEAELEIEPPPASVNTSALMQVLPADFPLPTLIRFVPDLALRQAVEEAATYALSLDVTGADGLQRADVAVTATRTAMKVVEEHFEEPTAIANRLHKQLTGVRGEWLERGATAVRAVGNRIYAEKQRLDTIERERRRKEQEEADRQAREQARREAEAAERAKAPAPVVEQLKKQAETATAAPVPRQTYDMPQTRNTTVTSYGVRFIGTPAEDDEPNPDVEALSTLQRTQFLELLKAVLDGKAPIAAVAPNWSYLNKRVKADKDTFTMAGLEMFKEGGIRAKGGRRPK